MRMMDSYDPESRQLRLDHPLAPTPLPRTRGRPLERLAARRRSGRGFSPRPLGAKYLARLLGSCRAWGGPEHRAFPSASASYATEVFVVGWQVENHTGRMLYYDPIDHGLVILPDPSPPWPEAQSRINAPVAGEPGVPGGRDAFPRPPDREIRGAGRSFRPPRGGCRDAATLPDGGGPRPGGSGRGRPDRRLLAGPAGPHPDRSRHRVRLPGGSRGSQVGDGPRRRSSPSRNHPSLKLVEPARERSERLSRNHPATDNHTRPQPSTHSPTAHRVRGSVQFARPR